MSTHNDLEIGASLPPFSIKINWPMYKKYNRLVNEINPLHFNEKYAKKLGYRAIVVAGVFTSSFFLRSILRWIKNPTNITKYEIRFLDPVHLEDTITQHATVTNKYEKEGRRFIEFDVWIENQKGQKVISGKATAFTKA